MVDGAPVPDTAMDTKSDDEPGDMVDTTPLTDDERALLDRLRDSGGESPAPTRPEDTLPVAPPPPTADPDPLDPVFREPTP